MCFEEKGEGLLVSQKYTPLDIYIIKQDILDGWTEWADIFCGHSWVTGGCLGLKKF